MTSDPFGKRTGLGSGLRAAAMPSQPPSTVPTRPPALTKTLDMSGPFPLTEAEIAKHCSRLLPHGNYAFGTLNEQGGLVVYYVGRFNKGGERLKHGVGRYTHFKISHAASEKESVEKECRNYHDFNPPHNKVHPACPEGMCCSLGCK
jgi:hypothetical protein